MAKKLGVVQDDNKADTVGMSLRLPPELYERLRKMNYEKREPMHAIIVRGIELALKAAKY